MTTLATVAALADAGAYYPHQQTWPGVYGPGYSSLCYGCHNLGKRSAEADPQLLAAAPTPIVHLPHPKAIYPNPDKLPANWGAPARSYTLRVPPPAPAVIAKREAEGEAEPEADPAVPFVAHPFYHPYGLIHPYHPLAVPAVKGLINPYALAVPALPAVPVAPKVVPVDLAGDGRGTHPNGGQVYNAPMTWPGK